ncbi:ParB/RepB/Spo0J family partition protein [Natrarchaeobius chitinivorans]|uniref:ParB-like N-terminal domain-containing protein n=1 Tax=Natrarchaeobius chitinivorans TaxID=1679083 RepID=A0A3N6MLG7_NATCH|nr:ParB/RepB/Spo0J family partition protein [Natrarchaeobius chitinivorans]RQG95186.1 hypothetical protein EA473_09570 [Natrarchaeobius chitinivorans]
MGRDNRFEEIPIDNGDVVVDREDAAPSEGVVVNLPPMETTEWKVHGRGTLASDNPTYPDDDRVVIAVYRETIEREYPNYSGGYPLRIDWLNRDDARFYAFPSQRLRKIGTVQPTEISLTEIDPSPYHARNFSKAENRTFIEEIRDRGHPDPVPLVRDCDDRFEVLNGHKRIWASHIAGLESIPCHCLYMDDEWAGRLWAEWHLDSYDAAERAVARRRLEANVGSKADEIITQATVAQAR